MYEKLHDSYFRKYRLYYGFRGPKILYYKLNLICIDSVCEQYTCDKCGYGIFPYLVFMGNNKYKCIYKNQCWDLKSYIRQDLVSVNYSVCSNYFIIPEIGNAFHTTNELIYFDQPIIEINLDTCILADGTLIACFYNKNNKIIAINQNGEEIDCYVLNKKSEDVFENEKYKLMFEKFETYVQSHEIRYTFINKANGKYTKAAAK